MSDVHHLSPAELEDHLAGQLRALGRACAAYDEGDHYAATDAARVLANLLLDRGRSTRSLLGRLGRLPMPFADASAGRYDLDVGPNVIMMSPALATLELSTQTGATYLPAYIGLAEMAAVPGFLDFPLWAERPFETWWEGKIVYHSEGVWSRRTMVATVRDKLGGSHIDPSLPADMQRIASGVGATFVQTGGHPIPNLHGACLRHIGEEVLVTLGVRAIA